jgi:hypothetical protein
LIIDKVDRMRELFGDILRLFCVGTKGQGKKAGEDHEFQQVRVEHNILPYIFSCQSQRSGLNQIARRWWRAIDQIAFS